MEKQLTTETLNLIRGFIFKNVPFSVDTKFELSFESNIITIKTVDKIGGTFLKHLVKIITELDLLSIIEDSRTITICTDSI